MRKKSLALLLVLTMLATLFVGVLPASASTTNIALTVPVVPGSAVDTALGTLKITETSDSTGSILAGQQITITLPAGVSFTDNPALGPNQVNDGGGDDLVAGALLSASAYFRNFVEVDGTGLTQANIEYVASTTKSLTIKTAGRADATVKASISFKFKEAGISTVTLDGATGDIAVDIYAPSTGVTQGSVVVATVQGAGTTTTVLSSKTISNSSSAQEVGTIRIAENRANSIKGAGGPAVHGTLKIDCTVDGVEIQDHPDSTINAVGLAAGNLADSANDDGYDRATSDITPTAVGATPGFLQVKLVVSITDRDLTGPLSFTIKGDGVTTQTVQVGTIADYGITAAADEPKTVRAGSANQAIANFSLAEKMKESFTTDRDFTVTLPSWAHWYTNPTPEKDSGDTLEISAVQTGTGITLNNTRTQISYKTGLNKSTSKTKYLFKDGKVFLDENAPEGNLDIEIKGKAIGETMTVTVAKVVKPVKATAAKADVKIGLANQAAGDITITESFAAALKKTVKRVPKNYTKVAPGYTDGDPSELILSLPSGVKFAATPTVEVTAGDIKLDTSNIKLQASDTELSIKLKTASTTASTIKVSGIKYTVNRTVPEGDVTVALCGDILDGTESSDSNYKDAVVEVANANTVTPAPTEITNTVVTFKIGEMKYVSNGAEKTMDVASYIKDDRTFLPVRYVGNALGITDANILWDAGNQTATFMKGDKVVQVKIGSSVMLVNGVAINMDAAPEIKDGRTMMSLYWVGKAFGASFTYDAATQTVTMSLAQG